MTRPERDVVEREVRRLIDASPFELFDLRIGQDRSLHIVIDSREGRITVGEIARFNHLLRRELVTAGINTDSWSIDVQSPGVFRPLRIPRHFEKSRGEHIRVVRRDPNAHPRVLTGTLKDVDAGGCHVQPDDGGPLVEIRFDDIAEAHLDPKLPF